MNDVTRILSAIELGDQHAADQLLPFVYAELRKLAAQKLAQESSGQTLQATALVHEAYLRLVGTDSPKRFDNCGHFFAAAAEAMRRILIDRARDRKRLKRGGAARRNRIELDALVGSDAPPDELLDLNDALDCLAHVDPRGAAQVKLRLFAGLTLDEAACALGISPRTADSDWRFARAWLLDRLQGAGQN